MKTSIYVGIAGAIAVGLMQIALAQPFPPPGLDTAPGIAIAAAHMPVCPPGPIGTVARCHSHVVVDQSGTPKTTISPVAYGPVQLRTGYNLNGSVGSASQIIAIVDAYDHPNIQSDLNTYSAAFGVNSLPTCIGNIASSVVPCFQKVDQNGGSNYPAVNSGWALEIALDVEVAHAVCPACSILLVEANSNSLLDLFNAVNTAANLKATVISNSYGTSQEFSGETSYDSYFNHPGIAITVSSGDSGYGTSYPAVSPYVTAVGGTSLYLNSNNTYNNETAWSGSGSGCSSQETIKPLGQPSLPGCSRRILADVAAVADPNTGAAVYTSVPYNGQSGWFRVGGTSLSSPIIAAVYALAGGVPAGMQGNSLPYARANYGSNMHDVTSGTNGRCGRNSALCSALPGFDGPTGLGTPNGIGAF